MPANAQVFYAKNISGGANTVTATFSTTITAYGILYIHEYSGIDQVSPVDVVAAGTGSGSSMNSGTVTTRNANDLLFGAGESTNTITRAGTNYISRSTSYGNITEDRLVNATGFYNVTATQNGNGWVMQLVAFKANTSSPPDTTPPSVPVNLAATSTSPAQINISWNASTDNVAVSGYKVFRGGSQIATTTLVSYSDSGLTPSTTYTYTISAFDAAGNVSAQSVPVQATTRAAVDTQAPTVPGKSHCHRHLFLANRS